MRRRAGELGASRRGGPAGEGRGSPLDSLGTPCPAMGHSPSLSAGLREASFPAWPGVLARIPSSRWAPLLPRSHRPGAARRNAELSHSIDEPGLSECGRWKGRGRSSAAAGDAAGEFWELKSPIFN